MRARTSSTSPGSLLLTFTRSSPSHFLNSFFQLATSVEGTQIMALLAAGSPLGPCFSMLHTSAMVYEESGVECGG